MSENNEKRKQAQSLLHSMTDIDDRFLEEAMAQPQAGEALKPEGRKKRRYSTWALTAAACLTVVIIGRYVTLNRDSALKNEQPSAVMEQMMDTELPVAGSAQIVPAVASDKAESVPAEASDNAVSMPSEDAGMAAGMPDEASERAEVSEDAPVQEEILDAASVQAINPFIDTKTLEEAQEIAGFELNVPRAEDPYTVLNYRAVEGSMLEIIYWDEKGTEGYRIRKAVGSEDISGDYSEYALEKTVTLADGTKVTLRGDEEDQWSLAVWTMTEASGEKEDYSFAICCREKTLTAEQITEMAEVMTQK